MSDPTPKEWISETKKCHYCGFNLKMVDYGDWGLCTNEYCRMIWNMFQRDKTHYDKLKRAGLPAST